jgi:hypothetical protein
MVLHVRLRLSQKHLSTGLTFTCIHAVCCVCLFCVWFLFDILMLIVSLLWLYIWMQQEGARGKWNLGFDESQDSFPPTWHHRRTVSISLRSRPWEFFLPCSLQRHVWCPALLSTLARTNQLLYSEQFNRNGPWCPKNHNQRWVPLFAISTCHPNRSHESPLAFIY